MKLIHKNTYLLTISIVLLMLGACTAHKKVSYLKNVDEISTEEFAKAAMNYEATIMPNDVLSITVNTPTNAASKDFNLPLVPQEANDVLQTRITSTVGGSGGLQNYIVDNDGYIDFPVLGRLKIGGLKKIEAEKKIASLIYPQYIKEEPIVNIRFLNYKVTVIGEVNKPGIYTSNNEQMTLFDALALAGDLTIYGKRNNVLLIRSDADGMLKLYRINLQDKETLLANETYYLQQNDKIYVEPNRTRGNASGIGSLESLTLSGLSLLISIIAIVSR